MMFGHGGPDAGLEPLEYAIGFIWKVVTRLALLTFIWVVIVHRVSTVQTAADQVVAPFQTFLQQILP